jgi:hypothetical protein
MLEPSGSEGVYCVCAAGGYYVRAAGGFYVCAAGVPTCWCRWQLCCRRRRMRHRRGGQNCPAMGHALHHCAPFA